MKILFRQIIIEVLMLKTLQIKELDLIMKIFL